VRLQEALLELLPLLVGALELLAPLVQVLVEEGWRVLGGNSLLSPIAWIFEAER